MTPALLSIFAVSCLAFSFSPGAGAVATMSRTLEGGRQLAGFNILGLQLALLLHLLVVSAGLGSLVAGSDTLFHAIKLMGSGYLCYLGIAKFRQGEVALRQGETSQGCAWQSLRQGFLVNLSNPKSIVFLVAFLPQFVGAGEGMVHYLRLGAIIIAIDTLAMVSYSLCAGLLLGRLARQGQLRWLNRGFGLIFIVLALLLALSGR